MVHTLLDQIQRLHRAELGSGAFRTHDVFCVAATGQKVRFAPWAQVPGSYLQVLEVFDQRWSRAEAPSEIFAALSIFWLGHIAVHPFADGNGRVGKKFVKTKLREKGIFTIATDRLDAILLTGHTGHDLQRLNDYFHHQLLA